MNVGRIRKEDLFTVNLKCCEHCTYVNYHGELTVMARCMITNKEMGLVEVCENFKKETDNHQFIFSFDDESIER